MRGCRQAGGVYNVGAEFTRTRPFFGSGKAFGSTQARWRARYNGLFIDDASPIAARQDAAEVFSFWVGMCSFWAIRGAAGEISSEVNVRFASTSPRNHLAPTT